MSSVSSSDSESASAYSVFLLFDTYSSSTTPNLLIGCFEEVAVVDADQHHVHQHFQDQAGCLT